VAKETPAEKAVDKANSDRSKALDTALAQINVSLAKVLL